MGDDVRRFSGSCGARGLRRTVPVTGTFDAATEPPCGASSATPAWPWTASSARRRGLRLVRADERSDGDLVRPRPLRQPHRLRRSACARDTLGVAHKTLPCGTQVTFYRGGRFVTVAVIDRGPFRRGVVLGPDRRAARRIGLASSTVRCARSTRAARGTDRRRAPRGWPPSRTALEHRSIGAGGGVEPVRGEPVSGRVLRVIPATGPAGSRSCRAGIHPPSRSCAGQAVEDEQHGLLHASSERPPSPRAPRAVGGGDLGRERVRAVRTGIDIPVTGHLGFPEEPRASTTARAVPKMNQTSRIPTTIRPLPAGADAARHRSPGRDRRIG